MGGARGCANLPAIKKIFPGGLLCYWRTRRHLVMRGKNYRVAGPSGQSGQSAPSPARGGHGPKHPPSFTA
eukprot:12364638-Alexandrium_andersonii.AAC.1